MRARGQTWLARARRRVLAGWVILLSCGALVSSRADSTWVYAVQISATVQASPPQITLHWPQDQYGANSYVVYRKFKDDNSWGSGTTLSGSATSFTDYNVSAGAAYEYQIIKYASLGYRGYGYIYAGIQAPMIESRGKLILVVAADTGALSGELSRLQTDLVGDGWSVIRHDVSAYDNPAAVKSLIQSDYYADASQVKAVFLFGHVPIVMSGNLEYDAHGARPLPADGFYGDIDGDWHLDWAPSSRPSFMPSEIELMVGRVDFYDMPGVGASPPWPSETELLRRYLNKDHNWRHKVFTVPRRALMANRVGDFESQAYAANGYRNFEPFVGPGNIVEANVSDNGPASQRWISLAASGGWLWSYGCGPGLDNVISQLGTHNAYNDLWSTDLVGQDAKVVFSMFFGSHFGDWTKTDNVMRAMLATSSMGLTAAIVGIPHWFCHHMAMGEPIGYATRLTMNNTTLYQNQSNAFPRAVFIDLLGDPALRMDIVAPPSGLSATVDNGVARLSWGASSDNVAGYHIYRSASPGGPFTRLTSSPVTGPSFTDSAAFPSQVRTYMVRAVALQENPSGSFYNPSQGIFLQVDVGSGGGGSPTDPNPVTLSAKMKPSGVEVTWNSQPGAPYHVEAKVLIGNNDWTDISGRITATSSSTSFTDANWVWYWTRWYRVVND